ncbi:MAG: hypothetical protein NPINA01_11210 [Nitrospinaceae bacterium]|nr:MAG: hypothetical protein NPINA01_11210 [Nitrospinaceae bacterium]
MVMSQKDPKIAEENIAVREKASIIAREFDRTVNTFKRVLEFKEKYGKNLEEKFEDLKISLKENLEELEEVNQNIEVFDTNSEKIIIHLKQLEEDEKKYTDQYEKLLRGVGVEERNLEAENSDNSHSPSSNESDEYERELSKILMKRREEFLENLKSNFDKLDEKLASIGTLKKELDESRTEISQRKLQALDKKKEMEEKGKKLVKEVGRLESELETTIREEKTLIAEFSRIVSHVENSLELDETTDSVLFSALSIAESPENTPAD